MRDDFVPPALTTEQKLGAAQVQLDRFRAHISKLNALATSMGYEGPEDALLSLQAMKRGPRRVVTAGAR